LLLFVAGQHFFTQYFMNWEQMTLRDKGGSAPLVTPRQACRLDLLGLQR